MAKGVSEDILRDAVGPKPAWDEFVGEMRRGANGSGLNEEALRQEYFTRFGGYPEQFADDGIEGSKDRFSFQRADEVEIEEVDWVIDQWLACGMVHLLAGQAGRGKTGIALKVASMITRGEKFPGGAKCRKGKVVIWSGEDSKSHVLAPRLKANGADMGSCFFVTPAEHHNVEFDPAIHMPQLERDIAGMETFGSGGRQEIRLLIIDPIVRVMHGRVKNMNDASQVRDSLEPLRQLAERTGIAVLGITHFLKRHNATGSDILDRILGSQAWGAVARIVWAVDTVGKGMEAMNILVRAKANIGLPVPSWEYYVKGSEHDQRIQVIEFGNQVIDGVHMIEQQDDRSTQESQDKSNARACAIEYLLGELESGPKTRDELIMNCDEEFTPAELKHASRQLKREGKATSRRRGFGKDSKVSWMLTTEASKE